MKSGIETKLEIVSESGQKVVFLRRMEKGWPIDFVSENITNFGYEPKEFFSKKILYDEIIYAEDLERVHSEFFNNYKKNNKDFTLEYRILTKSGNVRWVSERVLILPDRDKNVTCFSGTVFDITDRIESKETVRHKLETEKVLLEISNMFASPANLERDINLILEKIGILCGAERCYIFLTQENGAVLDNTHEWCAGGVEPQKDNLQNNLSYRCLRWMKKLHNDETIHITDVSALPPEAATEKEMLEKQGIRSLIVLPLCISGKLAGFVGMDNVVNTGGWGKDNVPILRIVANLIGMGIQRKQADESIHTGEEIYRSMFQNASNLIILADSNGNIIDCNSRVEELLGYRKDELKG